MRKKVKTYHDGFITVSDSRHARLLDADGTQVLCSTTIPRSQQLAPDVDGEFMIQRLFLLRPHAGFEYTEITQAMLMQASNCNIQNAHVRRFDTCRYRLL